MGLLAPYQLTAGYTNRIAKLEPNEALILYITDGNIWISFIFKKSNEHVQWVFINPIFAHISEAHKNILAKFTLSVRDTFKSKEEIIFNKKNRLSEYNYDSGPCTILASIEFASVGAVMQSQQNQVLLVQQLRQQQGRNQWYLAEKKLNQEIEMVLSRLCTQATGKPQPISGINTIVALSTSPYIVLKLNQIDVEQQIKISKNIQAQHNEKDDDLATFENTINNLQAELIKQQTPLCIDDQMLNNWFMSIIQYGNSVLDFRKQFVVEPTASSATTINSAIKCCVIPGLIFGTKEISGEQSSNSVYPRFKIQPQSFDGAKKKQDIEIKIVSITTLFSKDKKIHLVINEQNGYIVGVAHQKAKTWIILVAGNELSYVHVNTFPTFEKVATIQEQLITMLDAIQLNNEESSEQFICKSVFNFNQLDSSCMPIQKRYDLTLASACINMALLIAEAARNTSMIVRIYFNIDAHKISCSGGQMLSNIELAQEYSKLQNGKNIENKDICIQCANAIEDQYKLNIKDKATSMVHRLLIERKLLDQETPIPADLGLLYKLQQICKQRLYMQQDITLLGLKLELSQNPEGQKVSVLLDCLELQLGLQKQMIREHYLLTNMSHKYNELIQLAQQIILQGNISISAIIKTLSSNIAKYDECYQLNFTKLRTEYQLQQQWLPMHCIKELETAETEPTVNAPKF